MDRRQVIAAAVTGLVTAPALIRSAHATDKVQLLLNWYLYGEHAPFFLGKKLGLFEKEGIDLTIMEGRGSGVTLQAVGAKSTQYGYADMSAVIRAGIRGAPVVEGMMALVLADHKLLHRAQCGWPAVAVRAASYYVRERARRET